MAILLKALADDTDGTKFPVPTYKCPDADDDSEDEEEEEEEQPSVNFQSILGKREQPESDRRIERLEQQLREANKKIMALTKMNAELTRQLRNKEELEKPTGMFKVDQRLMVDYVNFERPISIVEEQYGQDQDPYQIPNNYDDEEQDEDEYRPIMNSILGDERESWENEKQLFDWVEYLQAKVKYLDFNNSIPKNNYKQKHWSSI